jgi:hypothetical protein
LTIGKIETYPFYVTSRGDKKLSNLLKYTTNSELASFKLQIDLRTDQVGNLQILNF